MTKYTVIAEVLTSLGIPVEAESPEEAIEQAATEGVHGLCHQCVGSWGRDSGPRWWREEGDEWREVSVTNENQDGKVVWSGPGLVTSTTLSQIRTLADRIEQNRSLDPVVFLREYADQLEKYECTIETGDDS